MAAQTTIAEVVADNLCTGCVAGKSDLRMTLSAAEVLRPTAPSPTALRPGLSLTHGTDANAPPFDPPWGPIQCLWTGQTDANLSRAGSGRAGAAPFVARTGPQPDRHPAPTGAVLLPARPWFGGAAR